MCLHCIIFYANCSHLAPMQRYRHSLATSSRSGITLIEIITVMAVMATLTIMTVPSVYSLLTAHGLTIGARDVSNHLVSARSDAIAKHTLTRFVVATSWSEEDGVLRKFSNWRWDAESMKFARVTKWFSLPKGIVFEPEFPNYLLQSHYALNDATSIHGEFALSKEEAATEVAAYEREECEVQFIEFLPTGAARIRGGILNTVIYVLVEGEIHQGTSGSVITRHCENPQNPDNWAQVNLGTLTGRVRILRP